MTTATAADADVAGVAGWTTNQLEQLAPAPMSMSMPWAPVMWMPPFPVSTTEVAESPFCPDNVPCHHIFEKRVPCPFGECCMFSHDPAVYMYINNLRLCPNPGCPNYCRGLQCKQCHHAMKDRRKAELHDCATKDCSSKTKFKLCKKCHTARHQQEQQQVIKVNA